MIKYLPFTLLILLSKVLGAQCDDNVSTDPNNPTNDNIT